MPSDAIRQGAATALAAQLRFGGAIDVREVTCGFTPRTDPSRIAMMRSLEAAHDMALAAVDLQPTVSPLSLQWREKQ